MLLILVFNHHVRLPYLDVIFHAQFLDSLPDSLAESSLDDFMGSRVIHLVKENTKIHVMKVRMDNLCLECAWRV